MVDVSWSSVFFESASRRGRAYLNEPTIEITNGDFCQRVFSRRYTRTRFLRREAWTILLLIYITPEYIGGRKKRDGGAGSFLAPTFRVSPFLFSFFFPLVLVLSSRGRGMQQVKTTGFSSVRQPPVQWIGTWRGAGLGLR